MQKWQVDSSWTFFLDRDGVINERIFDGYVRDPKEFVFKPGVLEALKLLNSRNVRIIVVTNQQGVSRGWMSISNLEAIHSYMLQEIEHSGGRIDLCLSALNLKGEQPDRRKPNKAMALEAKVKFPEIDFERAVMIGDTDSDVLFGRNLGMRTVVIRSKEELTEKADLLVDGLLEFVKMLE